MIDGVSNVSDLGNNVVQPPLTNRGVDDTKNHDLREPKRALVDWLQVTFPYEEFLEQLYQVLGLDISLFAEMDQGKYGYRKSVRCGHIAIYYDGKLGMGTHLEMTGQGCREYESLSPYKDSAMNTWRHLFGLFSMIEKVKYTRLDLALDVFDGSISTDRVYKHVKKKALTSQFRKVRRMTESTIKDYVRTGDTIYFGSAQSDLQIRFYDKKLERENNDKEVLVDEWTRVEFQLRDAHATMAAFHILAGANGRDDLGELIKGYLHTYLQFRTMTGDNNLSRRSMIKWYRDFLEDIERISLTSEAKDYTIDRVQEWVDRSVTPSLSTLLLANDVDPDTFLSDIVRSGFGRLDSKKKNAINLHRQGLGLNPLTDDEIDQRLLSFLK